MLLNAKEKLKNSIQNETQTKITLSKVKTDGTTKRIVEIKGATHNDVYSARQKIKSFNNGKNRDTPTHFTCVKITDSKIKSNFISFKVYFQI